MEENNMLSVIIPSRVDEYLQKTIDELLTKAEEPIEIIVVFDGYWPSTPLKDDPRVVLVHQGTVHDNYGMRDAINTGVKLAKGKYIMKIDEHCMVDQGFDRKLKEDCEDNWVVIPRRYRLDAENWSIFEDGRPPIDYMHIDYPYQRPQDVSCGLHGAEWKQRYYDRKDVLIDDTPSCQGSCYFMMKSHWDNVIKEMSTEDYGKFTQEAQEITLKTWFSGGRVIVNKKTWYAHYHKGSRGKGYGFSTEQYKRHSADQEKGRLFCINYWLYTPDYKYDWEWFVEEKFPNMPGWTSDWKDRIIKDRDLDFSSTGYKNNFWLSNLRKDEKSN